MASAALKHDEGTIIPGEGDDQTGDVQTGERDFEAEAREHGWSAKDEFKGDVSRWIDAETFMKRADEMMPLLKADKARLKRELDAIKKDMRRATAHFEGAEDRAYKRAKADIEAQIEAAVETGDMIAAKAAMKDLDELKPEPQQHSKEDALEALDAFREDNAWYDRANLASASEIDINGRLFYDRMVDKHIERTKDLAPTEFFAMIGDMTTEKYPALKGKAPRTKPASAVEGVGAGRPSGRGKTWDNLPDGARRQYERFITRGIGVKSTGDADKDTATARAYYAKSHDWEGYKE